MPYVEDELGGEEVLEKLYKEVNGTDGSADEEED
jgi:hypothetical protein